MLPGRQLECRLSSQVTFRDGTLLEIWVSTLFGYSVYAVHSNHAPATVAKLPVCKTGVFSNVHCNGDAIVPTLIYNPAASTW